MARTFDTPAEEAAYRLGLLDAADHAEQHGQDVVRFGKYLLTDWLLRLDEWARFHRSGAMPVIEITEHVRKHTFDDDEDEDEDDDED